jgi:photosystem II stability/assembly factor-like uncharacterized protein
MLNVEEGWAAGTDGIILYYSQGQWTESSSPTSLVLKRVAMVNENEGWAVGKRGTILHYQQGTWQEIEPVVDKSLSEIVMLDENTGWILADDLLLRHKNGIWEQVFPPEEYHQSFSTMGVVSPDEVWVMGARVILRYKADKWEVFDNPRGLGMAAIVMLNENEGWAVGDGILHYTNR